MSYIVVTGNNFENEVVNSKIPVLLDFWATWCGPCQMIAPVVEEIADERTDIKVGKVNVDEEPELAQAFGVESIPTLVVVKEKTVVNRIVGFRSKEEILDAIGL